MRTLGGRSEGEVWRTIVHLPVEIGPQSRFDSPRSAYHPSKCGSGISAPKLCTDGPEVAFGRLPLMNGIDAGHEAKHSMQPMSLLTCKRDGRAFPGLDSVVKLYNDGIHLVPVFRAHGSDSFSSTGISSGDLPTVSDRNEDLVFTTEPHTGATARSSDKLVAICGRQQANDCGDDPKTSLQIW